MAREQDAPRWLSQRYALPEDGGPRDVADLLQLLDLEEQKNRFLRQMSHELKTPLTAVREGSQLLAEEVVGELSPQQKEIAGILLHNSIELQKQIEALLNYGASQFHKIALDLKPVSLERVVSRVAGDQRLALRARDLKLDVSGPQVLVTADAEMLRIMLDNLVSNAIKFSPQGGTIGIHTVPNGSHVALEVVDEGPGVAPDERERIFEPFFRGDVRSSRQGLGLGLHIASQIAQAHGGRIDVTSTPDETRFVFRMPL
jgi:two-component system sensor histidine kinase GlrK